MLVIGVCGTSANEIAGRLARNVSQAEIISADTVDKKLGAAVLSLVYHTSKLRKSGHKPPTLVVVVVDPPNKGSKDYQPLNKLLASQPDSVIIPYYLYENSPSQAALGGDSTFQDFCDVIRNTTGFQLEVKGDPADRVLDMSISQTIKQWQEKELLFRSSLTDEERERHNVGAGKVITFTAVKGGSGKSSLALISANILTNWAADMQRRVLIMDCNLGQPVLVGLTWERPRKDIRWALSQIEEGVSADDVLAEVAHPLAAGAKTSRKLGGVGKIEAVVSRLEGAGKTIALQPEALYELVVAASRKYDYVVVDAPPIDPTTTRLTERFILPVSDMLLFVADSEYYSTQNAMIHYSDIAEHHSGKDWGKSAGFILNKFGEHTQFNMEQASSLASMRDQPINILGAVPYAKNLKESFNAGHKGFIPELPEVDRAIASILEKILEPEHPIASEAIVGEGKRAKRGLLGRKKK